MPGSMCSGEPRSCTSTPYLGSLGCLAFLSPQKSARRGLKRQKQDKESIDMSASGVEIPGGLAGIHARMAAMGHIMNATSNPPSPLSVTSMNADEVFGNVATTVGRPAPLGLDQDALAGEGFVLTSDFCTEDSQPMPPFYKNTTPAGPPDLCSWDQNTKAHEQASMVDTHENVKNTESLAASHDVMRMALASPKTKFVFAHRFQAHCEAKMLDFTGYRYFRA